MDSIGKYVNGEAYIKALKEHGFKYDPITKSLLLSYPYLPDEFRDMAVQISLYRPPASSIAQVASISFYRRGSDYKEVKEPGKRFKEYLDGILREAIEKARPSCVRC